MFWQVEGQTGLYVLFKSVCDSYDLLPAENYKLPPEAEGLEPVEEVKAPVPSIMKSDESSKLSAVDEGSINVGRLNTNTRRHIRQSPSVGSAVHTVLESDEEDPDIAQKLEKLDLADEESAAEVPVIVETSELDEQPESTELKAEPASEPAEEVEQLLVEQDIKATSRASSWDTMSSESLEEEPATQDELEKTAEAEEPEEPVESELEEATQADTVTSSQKEEKPEHATGTQEVPGVLIKSESKKLEERVTEPEEEEEKKTEE